MRPAILEKLAQALSKIDGPGSFCTSGSVPAVLAGLEVQGLGPISLPLTGRQAKELIRHCHQAPHGKGTKTVVDTSVRRVWRMNADQFTLTNPDWQACLAEMVRKVQQELGLEQQKLQCQLYDLLLYEPGGFFLPHRDGEKLGRMVATLVVVLPSSYVGGEIIVRHDGQERKIAFGTAGAATSRIHFAAFYADCEHEIRPLRKGHRLCLVYNLTLARSKKSITAPRITEHIQEIGPLIGQCAADGSPTKLVVTLDHEYTQAGLAWDTLKGVDRVRARVLLEAAGQAGCKAYLGLLTFQESGDAEYVGGGYGYEYGRYDRWDDEGGDEEDDDDYYEYDQDDASQYDMGEIFETSLTAEHLRDSDGNELPIRELSVDTDELLDPEALTDVEPEEDFEGYTGNAGMTLDRWYRHAAIFLWPERRHFEIVCDRDGWQIVPLLNQMVTRWRKARGQAATALKTQCIDLARAVLAKWSEHHHRAWYDDNEPKVGGLLRTLAALGDPALIGDFLGGVMIRDVSVDPGKSLASVCRKYGWATFQQQLRTIMKSTDVETMERNVRLLEQVAAAEPRTAKQERKLFAMLAQELVPAVEAIDRKIAADDWRSQELKRQDVLAGLVRALIGGEQPELLVRFLTHALAAPKTYPLRTVHMPALESLRPWLKKNIKKPSAPLSCWLAACREQLEAATATVPQEPTDFRRAAPIGCKCSDCAELKRFLQDPGEGTHRFSIRQDRRSHLESRIKENACDLNLRTERKRSPHTLVCTKNKASYQASLKTYHGDQERLKTVRSIEASLPLDQ